MAIIIDNVSINEIGEKSGSYSVVVTITDDIKNETETITISSARMDNEKQKTDLWDNIWKHYQDKTNRTNDLSSIESEAKAYLENK